MHQLVLIRRRVFLSSELRTELIRKSIHLSVAFVPSFVTAVGVMPVLALLAVGTLVYAAAEAQRRAGFQVPIISQVTELSARVREGDRYVLGPVTLGIGAMLALLLYPAPAASIAIYALAFGDGIASLVGKFLGSIPLPGVTGKTLEGSLACLLAIGISTYMVVPSVLIAVSVAAAGTLLEALPLRDSDNLVIPVGVGLVAISLL